MNKVLVCIFSICIGILSCKKNTEQEVKPKPEIKLATYFQNTNEEWYFEHSITFGPPSPIYYFFTYRVLRDTFVEKNGQTFKGVVMWEEVKTYGGSIEHKDTVYKYNEFAVYYDAEDRILYRSGTERMVLGNFNELDSSWCDLQRDTILIENRYYFKYVNNLSQEIIEGISLSIDNCGLVPAWYQIIPIGTRELARYTSDQYSSEWKHPNY